MRQPRDVRAALAILRDRLSGWTPSSLVGTKPILFTCPPVLTDRDVFGIRVRDLMVPACYTPLPMLGEMYERLIWWLHDGAPAEYRNDVVGDLKGAAKRFVGTSPERFCIWAGTHRDAHLNNEGGRLIVEGEVTFGIGDREVFTPNVRFPWFDGVSRAVYEPTQHSTRDPGFITLWKRACHLKDEESKALLGALRVGTNASFREMAPWVRVKTSGVDADLIGELIETAHDPIGEIYLKIVPKHLTRRQFEVRVAHLEDRVLDPGPAERERLWKRCRASGLI